MAWVKALLAFFGVVIALITIVFIGFWVAILLPFFLIIIVGIIAAAIVKHDNEVKKQKRSN